MMHGTTNIKLITVFTTDDHEAFFESVDFFLLTSVS